MKRCGSCNQTYADDMMFCLSDGTPLGVMLDDVEQQTVVRPSIATVAIPAATTAPTVASSAKYFVAGTAFLLLFGFIVLASAALIYWPRGSSVPTNANVANIVTTPIATPARTVEPPANADRADLKSMEDELERERKRLADERKKLEDDKRKKDDDPLEPLPPPSFNDPGTARISFRRGSVGETISGTVGRSRSYVLRTMSGQYLTANLSSSGNCAVFSGGSSSTGFTTGNGDTRLTVTNNCDRPASYRMSVAVR